MLLSLFDTLTKPRPVVAEALPREQQFDLEVHGKPVPVRILLEKRPNNRVSVNHNGVLIRLSQYQPREEQRKQIDTFMKWAKEKLGDKPEILESMQQRKYVDGELLRVGAHEFLINVFYHDLPKSTARIHRNHIAISLARGLSKEVESNTNSYLVAKCLAKFFTPIITQRLNELNERYFQKPVQRLVMKYNTSNWGSCSSQGNINISVRLMFAPPDVIDYVLIHELAHLVHHDHSVRFWKLVESILPDYAKHEKHLTENNYKYYL